MKTSEVMRSVWAKFSRENHLTLDRNLRVNVRSTAQDIMRTAMLTMAIGKRMTNPVVPLRRARDELHVLP